MKCILLILCSFLISYSSPAAFSSSNAAATVDPAPSAYSKQLKDLSHYSVKEIQVFLGRKLTVKEKVQWLMAKKLLRSVDPVDEDLAKKGRSKAYVGFGFGLASILIFPLFAIPGLIISNKALSYDRVNKGILGDAKGFAKAGQILSWVGIALLVVVILLVIALSSVSFA